MDEITTITDYIHEAAGNDVDMTTYSNLSVQVNAADHTNLWAGGVGSVVASGNVVTVTVPEDAAFFAQLADDGTESVIVRAEVTGDEASDSAKTVALVQSSQWTIVRREVGVA